MKAYIAQRNKSQVERSKSLQHLGPILWAEIFHPNPQFLPPTPYPLPPTPYPLPPKP